MAPFGRHHRREGPPPPLTGVRKAADCDLCCEGIGRHMKWTPLARRAVLCIVPFGVAGCDDAAESDGSARTLPVVTATRVRQLTEAETAGPLFRPDHVSRVGDDL